MPANIGNIKAQKCKFDIGKTQVRFRNNVGVYPIQKRPIMGKRRFERYLDFVILVDKRGWAIHYQLSWILQHGRGQSIDRSSFWDFSSGN